MGRWPARTTTGDFEIGRRQEAFRVLTGVSMHSESAEPLPWNVGVIATEQGA